MFQANQFLAVADLIAADEHSPLELHKFDDSLWMLLCNRITVEKSAGYPRPVVMYVASRYLQWDVGNGGFAQAAYNIPQWFPLAAESYDELGKASSARLIREAILLLPDERAELRRKGLFSATIARVFEHFKESKLAALDSRIIEKDWYIDEERVAYVRRNREVFRQIA